MVACGSSWNAHDIPEISACFPDSDFPTGARRSAKPRSDFADSSASQRRDGRWGARPGLGALDLRSVERGGEACRIVGLHLLDVGAARLGAVAVAGQQRA